jgi:hypothetical protein
MRTLKIALLVTALLLGPAGGVFAATTPGSPCQKIGVTTKSGPSLLKCSLVWVTQTNTTVSPSSTPTKSTSPSLQSKSFKLVSIVFNDGPAGGQADARMINISNSTRTALFTLTIFASDKKTIAATMIGSAQGVRPGEIVTVSFVGTQSLPSGAFSYTFQTDTEY